MIPFPWRCIIQRVIAEKNAASPVSITPQKCRHFWGKNKLYICACCRLPSSQAVAHSTLVKYLRRMSAKRSQKLQHNLSPRHDEVRVRIGMGRTSSTPNMLHVLVPPLRPPRSSCLPVPAFSWATKLATRGSWETTKIRISENLYNQIQIQSKHKDRFHCVQKLRLWKSCTCFKKTRTKIFKSLGIQPHNVAKNHVMSII